MEKSGCSIKNNMAKKKVRKLSDTALLQIAEMKSLCKWGEEKLKDLHFLFATKLDEGTDEEILEAIKKAQPFFLMLKQLGSDSDAWVSGSTKRVLEYYEKKDPGLHNRLDKLFKEEGSKLDRFVYIAKK